MLVQWQWLTGMGAVTRIGVDQQSLRGLLDEHPAAPEDKADRWALFNDVIAAGAACCEAWHAQQT